METHDPGRYAEFNAWSTLSPACGRDLSRRSLRETLGTRPAGGEISTQEVTSPAGDPQTDFDDLKIVLNIVHGRQKMNRAIRSTTSGTESRDKRVIVGRWQRCGAHAPLP